MVHACTEALLAIMSYTKWKKAMALEDKIWSTKQTTELQELAMLRNQHRVSV